LQWHHLRIGIPDPNEHSIRTMDARLGISLSYVYMPFISFHLRSHGA
jgi:hypothetical protein